MKTSLLLILFTLLVSCGRPDVHQADPLVVEGVDVAALMRPQAPWPRPTPATSPSAPVSVRVAVAPSCLLCDVWRTAWPTEVRVEWVWVTSGRPDQDDVWCRSQGRALIECRRALKKAFVEFAPQSAPPVGVASDGRVLTGWPDADWLRTWSGYPVLSPPDETPDAPLINI